MSSSRPNMLSHLDRSIDVFTLLAALVAAAFIFGWVPETLTIFSVLVPAAGAILALLLWGKIVDR